MLFCDVTGSTALGERLDRPWLWPNASGPTVFLFSGACAVNVRFCGQGRVPWARRETLATPMRSVDKCETCQPRTEADGQLVTESNLSLRVPARVAAMCALAVWDLSAVIETERMIGGRQVGQVRAGGAAAPPALAALSMASVAIYGDQDRREGHRPLTSGAPVSPGYAYGRVTGTLRGEA